MAGCESTAMVAVRRSLTSSLPLAGQELKHQCAPPIAGMVSNQLDYYPKTFFILPRFASFCFVLR